jgi:hypothetical protein
MSDAIYVRVENIFRDILTHQQFETLHPTATMDDVDGWDSMLRQDTYENVARWEKDL